ncbi:MAG: ATPase, T2SS/T4P/T4SS family [Candidatus Xenobiia bacterium LiM19]
MVITPEAEELLMNYGIIQAAMMYDASDIHICPGNPPIARINGRLNNIGSNPLSSENVEALVRVLTDRYKMSEFFGENPQDIDYTMEIPSLKRRFRINVFRQHYGPSIVMRILSNEVKNFQELGLPKKLEEISLERSGFFLVTGGTGSGKSRTLCAMLETINERVEKHIITIEDPIEIVFRNKMALIESGKWEHMCRTSISLSGAL